MKEYLNGRVVVAVGDITQEETDAIVNAANSSLMGGGGVDGAIHLAGGPKILEECKRIRQEIYPNGLPIGKAVITTGGNLKAKWVIHTVGPIYGRHAGREPELLAECYRNSLLLAVQHNIQTISFPSISTGAYGYPKEKAAEVASETIYDFLSKNESIKLVRLIFFSPNEAKIFIENHKFPIED